jgi:hypothetical protein
MNLRQQFLHDVAGLRLASPPGAPDRVEEADLDGLPAVAARYLRAMGVVGRPRAWSLRAGWAGRFRPKVGASWTKAEAWQYNSAFDVARIMHLRIRFAGILPATGRDSYVRGEGRLQIRLPGGFRVLDDRSEETAIGQLVTYLDDAVLLAPSMLLTPAAAWSPVDDESFGVSLTDRGRTVAGRVFLDEQGRPRDFRTTDRFLARGGGSKRMERTPWTTPVLEWGSVDGRPVPLRVQAVWHLPDGDFPYADLRLLPEMLAFNVPPGT